VLYALLLLLPLLLLVMQLQIVRLILFPQTLVAFQIACPPADVTFQAMQATALSGGQCVLTLMNSVSPSDLKLTMLQGGNAREATVAKMCEEVEAHAIYERTAALARATGSCRLPKLRPSPSSPTGWALTTQQSMQAMPLHALTKQTSTAARVGSPVSRTTSGNKQYPSSQSRHPTDDCAALQSVAQLARQAQGRLSHAAGVQLYPSGVSREAQLLEVSYSLPKPASTSAQDTVKPKPQAAKESIADLGGAIVFEEKYHRAGREVTGQRVDHEAIRLAAAEHAKQTQKARQQQLGFKPLRHDNMQLLSKVLQCNKLLPPSLNWMQTRDMHRSASDTFLQFDSSQDALLYADVPKGLQEEWCMSACHADRQTS